MLLQITNKCHMLCPHCFQDSNPEGEHMSLQTFSKVLDFILENNITMVSISGGEPTLHPDIDKICQVLHNYNIYFNICSNGMWCTNDLLGSKVYGILSLSHCLEMQICSNPKWYKEYDFIMSRVNTSFNHPKIHIITRDIPSMQDLGRARTCKEAHAEVLANKYHMSCLNSHLIGAQSESLKDFFFKLESRGWACKPAVDYKGYIHMSESHLCPAYGNIVNDSYEEIWKKISTSKPCLQCYNARKFMESSRLDIIHAKKLLKLC